MNYPIKRTLVRTLVGILIAIPVVFFVLNIHDKSFRDGAIGNWFGTALGVLVGVPIGLEVAWAQQKAQAKEDAHKEKIARDARLLSTRQRVYAELQYNSEVVATVIQILSQSSARIDLWEWAVQGVNAVEFDAYQDLDSMLMAEERVYHATLELAYNGLRRAVNKVRQSRAAFEFLMGYSGNETEARKQFDETRKRLESAHVMVDVAMRELERR